MTGVLDIANARERNRNLTFAENGKTDLGVFENYGTLKDGATTSANGLVIGTDQYVSYVASGETFSDELTFYIKFTQDYDVDTVGEVRFCTLDLSVNKSIRLNASGTLDILIGGFILSVAYASWRPHWNDNGANCIIASCKSGYNVLYINGTGFASFTAWVAPKVSLFTISSPFGKANTGITHDFKIFRTALTPAEAVDLCTYGYLPNVTRTFAITETAFKTEFGINDRDDTMTTDFVANSPFEIVSGSYQIAREDIDGKTTKVIEWISSGAIVLPISYSHQTPTQAACGSLSCIFSKTGGGTFGAMPIASTNGAWITTGQDGYLVYLDSSEKITIFKITNGSLSFLADSGAERVVLLDFNDFYFTRDIAGSMVATINNVSVSTTDNTYTESRFVNFDGTTGGKLAYASIDGSHAITKETL